MLPEDRGLAAFTVFECDVLLAESEHDGVVPAPASGELLGRV